MVGPDEYYSKAYSGLWKVFRGVLCVEVDEVVHGRGLRAHISYKFLELFEGYKIF